MIRFDAACSGGGIGWDWRPSTTRKHAKDPDQKYHLLFEPILMWSISGLYEPGTGHWVPGHGMTRFQCFNMGTGSCDKPGPNGEGDKGTGLWHRPVPILQSLAPGHAMTRCRLVPTAKASVGPMTRCRCATFCTGSLDLTGAFGPHL